ncbi:TPA: KilA-N domain-containing protein [Yersinia enterocolitica]
MNTLLTIDGHPIRQFLGDLYCLNDLHKASGGAPRQKPPFWIRTKSTQKIIEGVKRLRPFAIRVIRGGDLQGTYASKELAFAYAIWISPEFYIRVISECSQIFSLQGKTMDNKEYYARKTIDYLEATYRVIKGDRLTAEALGKEGSDTAKMIVLLESAEIYLQKAIESYTYATLAREQFFGSLSSGEIDKTIKFLRGHADHLEKTGINEPIEYQGVGLDWLNAQDGEIH